MRGLSNIERDAILWHRGRNLENPKLWGRVGWLCYSTGRYHAFTYDDIGRYLETGACRWLPWALVVLRWKLWRAERDILRELPYLVFDYRVATNTKPQGDR